MGVAAMNPWLLSNLRGAEVGLDGMALWFSCGEFESARASAHGPRVIVVPGTALAIDSLEHGVAITLTEPPEVLGELPTELRERAVRFIRLNRLVLLRHWNQEIDTRQVLDLLTAVP